MLGSAPAGFVVVFGAFIASQLVVAAIVDECCSVTHGRSKLTARKCAGLAIVLAGAAFGIIGPLTQTGASPDGPDGADVALGACLGLLGGVALIGQTMLNTQLAARLHSVPLTTMTSLAVALFVTTVVCTLVTFATPGGPDATIGSIAPGEADPVLWLGGIGTVLIVASGAIVPAVVGVTGFSVALIAGQLLMSILLDVSGALGGTGVVSAWVIASTVTVFVGAAVIQVPGTCSRAEPNGSDIVKSTSTSILDPSDASQTGSPIASPSRKAVIELATV